MRREEIKSVEEMRKVAKCVLEGCFFSYASLRRCMERCKKVENWESYLDEISFLANTISDYAYAYESVNIIDYSTYQRICCYTRYMCTASYNRYFQFAERGIKA